MKNTNRLGMLRREKGFTRNSFAKLLGIPSSTLRNYELSINEPRKDFWITISQYFNVSLEYLLGISDERTTYKENAFTEAELILLEKYRELDTHGKELIDMIVDMELSRCISVASPQSNDLLPSDTI